MLPVLLLLIIDVVACQRTAQLKGNLLFETEQQSTVTINPHYLQFNRQFDLSYILQAINLLSNYTESYNDYCNDIQRDRKRVFDTFQTKGYTRTSAQACQRDHGYLPEIRSQVEADRLMELMKLVDITETPAGLIIEKGKLVYARTGGPNEFKAFNGCRNCSEGQYMIESTEMVVYAYDTRNDLYIKNSKCKKKD
jgi:hypothetical protein